MSSKNALTGAVMLETQWATRQHDLIDLISPFVMYCVAKTTSPKEVIDITRVANEMEINFGYVNIPEEIIIRVFKRDKHTFLKNKSLYILNISLDDTVCKIEERRRKCEVIISNIGLSLYSYLNPRCKREKINTTDQAIECLHNYFRDYGLDIAADRVDISEKLKQHSETNYYIARFIIEKKNSCESEYRDIIDLVKGYYLESALYLQPGNTDITNSNYKKVNFYYDTPFLLQLLGYLSKEEENKARCLHEMLKKQGGHFYYFPHTQSEIFGILNAYGRSLLSPPLVGRTLEGLDNRHYNYTDVCRIKTNFDKTLSHSFDIELAELPSYPVLNDGTVNESCILDESELSDFIREDIGHYKDESLVADIASVVSIHKLRIGYEGHNIEQCRHIFVTTNGLFVNAINKYYQSYVNSETFDLAISATHLAAITWVKNTPYSNDIPEIQLLENAYSAQQPLPELMDKIADVLRKMEYEGAVTYSEAISLKSDHFAQKEFLLSSGGDPNFVTPLLVSEIKDKYEKELITNAQTDTEHALLKRFQNANKIKNDTARQRAERMATEMSIEAGKKTERRLKIWSLIISFIIILISIYFYIISNHNILNSIPSCILTLISLFSIYDTVIARKRFMYKLITQRVIKVQDNVFEQEYNRNISLLFGEADKEPISVKKMNNRRGDPVGRLATVINRTSGND